MNSTDTHDAIIIGGGPTGCSAATVLAEKGHDVLVLEREKFPRYHIGESLLPFTYEPLQRLGLIDRMRESAFVKKYSVQFVAPSGKASQPFYFWDRYDRDTVAQTWQVMRADFDLMLMNRARDEGADVREEMTVKELIKDGGNVLGVRAVDKGGNETEFRAPITVDCTGKEAFAAVRNQWRKKDPYLNKVAVWTYYKGSKRAEGTDEGQTTVAFVPEKGWFWHIPLHDDMVSVGVVGEGKYLSRDGVKKPEEIFKREIENNLWIKDCLSEGEPCAPYYITSEYSFHSQYAGCEGLILAGDAFCFLDPVFSSGLMLALKSGVMVGDEISDAIQANDFAPSRFAGYAAALREGIENMRKLIYAFYEPGFSFKQVIDKYPSAAGDITDCLSGDVNKDFSHLWKAISEFAPIPDELPYGQPMMPENAEQAA